MTTKTNTPALPIGTLNEAMSLVKASRFIPRYLPTVNYSSFCNQLNGRDCNNRNRTISDGDMAVYKQAIGRMADELKAFSQS